MNLENLNVVELDAQQELSFDGGWSPFGNAVSDAIGAFESGQAVFSAAIGFLAGVHDGIDEAFND